MRVWAQAYHVLVNSKKMSWLWAKDHKCQLVWIFHSVVSFLGSTNTPKSLLLFFFKCLKGFLF